MTLMPVPKPHLPAIGFARRVRAVLRALRNWSRGVGPSATGRPHVNGHRAAGRGLSRCRAALPHPLVTYTSYPHLALHGRAVGSPTDSTQKGAGPKEPRPFVVWCRRDDDAFYSSRGV